MSNPTEPMPADLILRRWQPFDETLSIEGVDLSDADMQMQVRLYPDAPGDPLIDLVNQSPLGQGLSASVTFTDGIPTTTIRILINETTGEALLPFPANGAEPGDVVQLAYDLVGSSSKAGWRKARWFEGSLFLTPGVTQA